MRIMWRAGWLGALIALGVVFLNGTALANGEAAVHVKASTAADGAARLDVHANGPFEYTTYRPSESLYVVDLSGVSTADAPGVRVVPSELLKSYRVIAYASGARPIVRLEVLLSQGVEPRVERPDSQDLSLLVSAEPSGAPGAATSYAPPKSAVVPVAANLAESKIPSGAFEAIQKVNLGQNGDETKVSILGSGPLNYHAMHLQNPDRLVLDFTGAHLKTSVHHIASNLDPVREIRLGQFSPEVSRVVIDLRQPARYSIDADGNAVNVSFSPSSPAEGGVNSAPAADSSSLVTAKTRPQTHSPREHEQARTGEIPAPNAALPPGIAQSSSALAAPKQIQAQQAIAAASNAAKADSTSEQAASAAAPSPDPKPAAMPQPANRSAQTPTPVSAPSTAAGKYAGEPISVNLKDVDLQDFFRLIHEVSGLNVVVDPNVKGTLTIVLDDVPWDQALDIVLRNNDLDKQLDGNVLRIATKETLRKEAEESRDLAKAQAEAADIVTTTRVLSYAKATDMATALKKFLSPRGDILADDRSNTLIIRDIPSTFPVIDNLLRQLDRKSQQVEIEARVVAANRSFSREIGTQFGFAFGATTPSNSNIIGGATSVGTSPIIRNFPPLPAPPIVVGSGGATATSGSIPLNTNMPAAVPTSGFSYSFSSANVALDAIITAAEERGVGKLLSKPKVITQNNEKATVKQGTKIPVQTIVNNTVSVQFVDAVLELDVTPQVTADGTVYMDVTVENDQIDQAIPRVEGIPAIDTQSAETKVTVTDGATVVIGGIIVNQQHTDIQQVPLVGSIPVLGNLFKHTTVSSTAQELLFFLTPRILPM